jgi:DeoR/GlpR family transcriptional regulator of sugar metabolism
MVAAARRIVAIVDHTRWGRVAAATFCRTERIDTVITDASAPVEMVDSL